MTATAFLNKYCKPIMRQYYLLKYRKDILAMLSYFSMYSDVGISRHIIVGILVCDGWTTERAMMTWGYCVYCGLIEQKS